METASEKVLLIDLENCPSQIKQLQDDLATFSKVLICYANNSPRIPLDWLGVLAVAVHDGRLKIIRMESGGKNSADFGICFFAGALMHEVPKETHFVIISNDTDLDHVVRLLASQGRSAERVGKQKDEGNPFKVVTPSTGLMAYCTHLVKHAKTRPASEATLRASIKNKFKDDLAASTEVFEALLGRSAVKVSNGKVVYNDAVLTAISLAGAN